MTLKRIYHCAPSTISGDSQISGLELKRTIATTANGKRTLAGKAARNCASGWTRSVQAGRSPIQTPTGTQISVASAISTMTRSSVKKAEPSACQEIRPGESAVPT